MEDGAQIVDWSRKEVFSTGEAAKICNISQQTIIRCFDCGVLQGFRVPGSRFRRIPRDELIRFMKEHDIPVDRLERSSWRILLVDDSRQTADRVRETLEADGDLEVRVVSNGFDAGVQTERFRPHVVLISTAPRLHWESIVQSVRDNPQLREVQLVVIASDGEEIDGIDDILRQPLEPQALRDCLETLLPVPAIA